MQIQTKTKITETQSITKDIITTKTIDTIVIKTKDTVVVATNKTTDTITIAILQTNNKTETTQEINHVDIVTQQIISPEIVKPVLTAENWDICLLNVEHHDNIRIVGN